MIEKCNSTHARNQRKARQAHMKKMVLNEDAFTRRFRAAKGVQTRFFFGFGAIVNKKKASPDPFHESMVRKVYTAKISGPYQLFLWVLFLWVLFSLV